MHGTLAVKEALRAPEGENPFVPDVGMNVEALPAVEPETDKPFRRYLIAGSCQWHVEGFALLRKEQLPAIRVVVRMP